ncbi:hypothetical protein B0H17DRAFT_1134423 [Mycena rosella]|uniref:Ribonuclease H1 N-terminal domain-containing protein n=1 Tax=Mycena rosella TaxID=1033263 RepID=A0AAD7DFE9_MYCRO|nr:hypothetical protein B0H17DRAFT_1134423 [Mycena rosella]
MTGSDPEDSWHAALRWAAIAEEVKSPKSITAYSKAFQPLPEILWVGNILPVRHEAIRRLDIGRITSTAARTCIIFPNLASAVEIMEQGLGIIFQQMLQLKTDLSELPPYQANKLQLLSSEIYSGLSLDPTNLVIQRLDLLKEIRQQPGLEYFLLPKPYKALCHASQGGPVIILNSHHDHCDGIIILNPDSDPVHLPLPDGTLDMLKSQQKAFKILLGRCNVESPHPPDSFTICNIRNGRLWWLPTGAFTGLPLHASSSTNQFIHSYTATLESLLDAYSKKSPITPKVGIVGVTDTGGGSNYTGDNKRYTDPVYPQLYAVLGGDNPAVVQIPQSRTAPVMPIIIKCTSEEEGKHMLNLQQVFEGLNHHEVDSKPEIFAKAIMDSTEINELVTMKGPFYAVYRGKTQRAVYVRNYAEMENQVHDYTYPKFHRFESIKEALVYMVLKGDITRMKALGLYPTVHVRLSPIDHHTD